MQTLNNSSFNVIEIIFVILWARFKLLKHVLGMIADFNFKVTYYVFTQILTYVSVLLHLSPPGGNEWIVFASNTCSPNSPLMHSSKGYCWKWLWTHSRSHSLTQLTVRSTVLRELFSIHTRWRNTSMNFRIYISHTKPQNIKQLYNG